jgi:hypothetical protein
MPSPLQVLSCEKIYMIQGTNVRFLTESFFLYSGPLSPKPYGAGLRHSSGSLLRGTPKYRLIISVLMSVPALHAADAAEVWEQVIQAKGGHERLRAVHSLAIYMQPANVILAGPITSWLCVFPNRYVEFDGRGGHVHSIHGSYGVVMPQRPRVVVVDADANRVSTDANGMPRSTGSLTEVERDQLALNQVVYMLETAWLRPSPVSFKHTTLTVEAEDLTFDLFLDKAMLPERIIMHPFGRGTHTYDYHLQHYRDFHGIQLPASVVLIHGRSESNWDVDYELDARFNPSIFSKMPDLANGPEPWK